MTLCARCSSVYLPIIFAELIGGAILSFSEIDIKSLISLPNYFPSRVVYKNVIDDYLMLQKKISTRFDFACSFFTRAFHI